MDPNRTFAAHRTGGAGSAARRKIAHRRSSHPWLAAAVVAGWASGTMLFGPAGVATARDCPITDPSCLQDQLDDVQQTVDGVVSGAQHDAATVEDSVVSTVGGLTDVVGGLTDTVGQPPGGDGPGAHRGGGVSHHHPGGSPNRHVQPSGAATGPTVVTREGGTLTQVGSAIGGEADAGPADAIDRPSAGTRLREAAAGIAVALMIVLGALLLFMTIQARLDRRDPKLALAPVTADVVTFI
jgi:hypothetical protein